MVVERGPNINLLDHVRPVREDALFNSWRSPIPPEWFSANSRAYTLVDQTALYGSLKFSTFYGRVGADTVPTPTDSVVTFRGKLRFPLDIIAVPAELIVTQKNYFRGASDSTTVTDAVSSVRNRGSLIKLIIDRRP